MKFKVLLKNILTFSISILVTLILCEIIVRLFVPTERYLFSDATTDWRTDDLIGWKNKENYSESKLMNNLIVTYQSNQDGLMPKDATREKVKNTIRILLVGNSTVMGRSVASKARIHNQLDSVFNKKGLKTETINASVQGYATDQCILTLEKLLPLYNPDIVLYGYCDNDFYANLSSSYSGLSKPYYSLEKDSLIVHLPTKNEKIERYGDKYSIRSLIQYSALYGLIRPFIQQIRLLTNKKQAVLDQGISHVKYMNKAKLDTNAVNLFTHLIKEMDSLCKKNNTQFMFYSHPSLESSWKPYVEKLTTPKQYKTYNFFYMEENLKKMAKDAGVEFIPMTDYFLNQQERGEFHLLPNDPHCNPKGYLLQAENISTYINNNYIK